MYIGGRWRRVARARFSKIQNNRVISLSLTLVIGYCKRKCYRKLSEFNVPPTRGGTGEVNGSDWNNGRGKPRDCDVCSVDFDQHKVRRRKDVSRRFCDWRQTNKTHELNYSTVDKA